MQRIELRLVAEHGDVHPLAAVSLADALCVLVGPVVVLVEDLERGSVDASTLAAVLRVTLDAYQTTAAAGFAWRSPMTWRACSLTQVRRLSLLVLLLPGCSNLAPAATPTAPAEAPAATPTAVVPPPEPDQPQWWCFENPVAQSGWCAVDREGCEAEKAFGKNNTECARQPTAHCFRGSPTEESPMDFCHPTAVMCSKARYDLEGVKWKVSPNCSEITP